MKLIKLNEEHYIIVDDLVTDVNDLDIWVYDDDYDEPLIYKTDEDFFKAGKSAWKITHSNNPLEKIVTENSFKNYAFISTQEIEETIFGYSLKKIANESFEDMGYHSTVTPYEEKQFKLGYKHGFNAHKELVMARFLSTQLYSNENHLEWIYNRLIEVHGENSNYDYMIEFKKIIQSLQPKTEWNVEFISGKLTLKD